MRTITQDAGELYVRASQRQATDLDAARFYVAQSIDLHSDWHTRSTDSRRIALMMARFYYRRALGLADES